MKQLLTAIAVAGLIGTPALAADMAVKTPPAPLAPVYSFTGFYIGLNAGGNWGTSHTSTTVTDVGAAGFVPSFINAFNIAGAPASFDTSGFTGGIQGGYNWQAGNWLAGLEVDYEYFRSAGSKRTSVSVAGFPGSLINVTSSISTNWLLTVRPRLGIIVANNWLLYATGGLAVTQLKASWGISGTSGAGIGDTLAENASASSTKAGWVVGGGVETALPGNWLIGAEYLYVDFGSVSATSPNIPDPPFGSAPNPVSHSADLKSNIVRARLSYTFH